MWGSNADAVEWRCMPETLQKERWKDSNDLLDRRTATAHDSKWVAVNAATRMAWTPRRGEYQSYHLLCKKTQSYPITADTHQTPKPRILFQDECFRRPHLHKTSGSGTRLHARLTLHSDNPLPRPHFQKRRCDRLLHG